jgi:hypothetical protein
LATSIRVRTQVASGIQGGAGRATRPSYYSPYNQTGLGVVPRRSTDVQTAAFLARCHSGQWNGTTDPLLLAQFSATFPLRLLRLFAEMHPIVSLARRNNICLAFAPGDTRIVALKQGGEAGKEQVDDAGTAELENLFDSHGGLRSLQVAGANAAMTDGLLCYEAVPGPTGTGIADLFTFDSMTTQFRPGKESEPPLVLQQRQDGGWEDLPAETVFYKAVDGTRDNPYGCPLFSAVVTEALSDVKLQRTLQDVLDGVAWPRLAVGFDLPMLIEFAKENYGDLGLAPPGSAPTENGAPTITEWAVAQFQALQTLMEQIKASDTFIFTKGSEPKTLNGGNLQGTEGTLEMQRHRLVMAVDQPPTLLGIDTGGTLAYSSTQWKAYALKLEALRDFVNTIIVQIANLHFRLLGVPLVAKAEVQPIRSEDMLMLAQSRQIEIQNERQLIVMGFTAPEDACVRLTGSGVVDKEKADNITAPSAETPTAQPGQGGQGSQPGQRPKPGAHHRHRPAADARTDEIRNGMLDRARERREKRNQEGGG